MRAAGYIRVSTEEQAREGFSLAAQRERIEALCKAHGWELVEVYADDGYSGKDLQRPHLRRLMEHARQRRFDVVVVWRLDRLSRRQRHVLQLVEELFEPNGIAVVSCTEAFETATPAGKAMLGMLAVFAQLERDTIIERSRLGLAQRTRQGLWSGRAPYGYQYDREAGVLRPSPAEAAVVRLIYELYLRGEGARGWGLRPIVRYLKQHRIPSPYARDPDAWTISTVRIILMNRTYCGYRKTRTGWAPAKHEPIIDEVTWQRVQQTLQGRAANYGTHLRARYLLTGLAVCGSCGGPIRGRKREKRYSSGKQWVRRYYVCEDRYTGRAPHCDLKFVRADLADQRVVEQIGRLSLLDPAELRAQLAATLDRHGPDQVARELEEAQQELRRLEQRIRRYLTAFEAAELDAPELRQRLSRLREERDALQARVAELEARLHVAQDAAPDLEELLEAVMDFPRLYEDATPEERRELLRTVCDRVIIYPDGSVKVQVAGG